MNGHVVYGQALFDAGRYDDAAATFNTALGLDPENLIALRHLGDIARLSGDGPMAIQWYTRVLEADPRNDEILAYLQELKSAPAPADAPAPAADAPREAVEPPVPHGPAVDAPPQDRPRAAEPEPARSSAETPPASPAVGAPESGTAKAADITAQNAALSPPTPVAPIQPVPPTRPGMPLMDLELDVGPGAEEASAPAAPAPDVTPAVPAVPAVPALGDIEFTDIGTSQDAPAGSMGGLEPTGLDAAPPADGLELDTGLGWDLPDSSAAPEAGSGEVAPAAGGDSGEVFVTETMAELYLQQGLREEALEVYRKLAAQNPDDRNLQERVRSLESGRRSSLSLEVVSDETPEYAAGTDSLIVMTEVGGAPGDAGLPDAPEEAAPVDAAPEAATRRPTARTFFAALAQRRPLRPDGTAPAGIASVPPPAPPPPRDGGSVDALFSDAPAEADEAMGAALATAVGQVEPAPAIHGRPTQPAGSDFSLDTVFRGEGARRVSGAVQRQSQHLKFDQFFATSSAEADPGAPPAAPPAAPPPADPEAASTDDAWFQSWLKGLKGQ